MQSPDSFPLQGVIGVVANSVDEVNTAAEIKLQCIELRADLLLDSGLSVPQVLSIIEQAGNLGLATLFTLRHPTHGGKFNGSEKDRVDINRLALDAGADIIDLEWDTEAAEQMLGENAPLILSYHNFNTMPDERELSEITTTMESAGPLAIKVVPTASTLTDSVRMLQWVARASDKVRRIGFAMGETGACSRILTIAHGAPVTYASFGEAVAPGQVAIDALLGSYKAMALNTTTGLHAVTGEITSAEKLAGTLNQQFTDNQSNQVAIAFTSAQKDDLIHHTEALRISEIHTV